MKWLRTIAQLAALHALFVNLIGCDVTSNNGEDIRQQQVDPVVVDFPIAYVERPLPADEDGNPVPDRILEPAEFHPGAQLVIKDRATADAHGTVITAGLFPATEENVEPLYDVKDLEVSVDGKKLLFAMRAPEIEDADDDEQPTWNIWEYDREAATLRRIIASDLTAERGHDIAPQYLADGRIVFSSTRQARTRAILLDEFKPQYSALDDKRQNEAMVLHVMNDDGSKIEQITFNVSHDLQPTVLASGDILFVRWDAINSRSRLSLYRIKPDGQQLELYYGFHSQRTGSGGVQASFMQPRELDDGRIVALLRTRTSARLGGDIVAIDGENYIDVSQPITANAGAAGPGHVSLISNSIDSSDAAASLAGVFSSAYPLHDGSNRLLVSWSQCRLRSPATGDNTPCTEQLLAQNAEPAAPLFGLWIYDTHNGTQRPVNIPDEGTMYTDAVTLSPRRQPDFAVRTKADPELASEQVGVLHIRSVYDIDGEDTAPGGIASVADPVQTPAAERPVRFLRIVKPVPIPDDNVLDFDNSVFGRSDRQNMRDIVGYVPVEPDGSAKFKVPADIPFMIDILDASGKRIRGRHEVWLSLRPGEQRECTGCHTRDGAPPHGRLDAEAESANPGAIGGMPFINTQLLDPFGTPQPAPEFAESMAEYYARVNGPRTPSVDLIFTDEWTDPNAANVASDVSYRYLQVGATVNSNPGDTRCAPLNAPPPHWYAPTECIITGSWTSQCRSTINYIDTIQPLWQADRRRCDEAGVLVHNVTCTACHSRGPADAVQLPAAQLELTGDISQDQNDYLTSYAALMFQDNEQELVDGSLTDVIIEIDTGEVERDADGEAVLDENGNTIPIILRQTVPVPPLMTTDGARESKRFFTPFGPGGSHENYLSPDELKLIAEWLDIGAQYYNNPFDAPAD